MCEGFVLSLTVLLPSHVAYECYHYAHTSLLKLQLRARKEKHTKKPNNEYENDEESKETTER